jgi:hypothetical protein
MGSRELTIRACTRVGFAVMQYRCAPSDTRRALCLIECGPPSVRLFAARPGRAAVVVLRTSLPSSAGYRKEAKGEGGHE